jgi:hypothetical protein
MNSLDLLRRSLCCGVAVVVLGTPALPRAQAGTAIPQSNITYILPHWSGMAAAPLQTFLDEVTDLRARIPQGPRVKVGFTTYVYINMNDPLVNPSDTAGIQAALAGTFQQMDAAINRAVASQVPICLSFLTTIRDLADAVEVAGEANDRRNMQWYSRDNMLASNWSTYSRYARKQRRLQEAYMREIGRRLATRMAQYPDVVVAASGDGEVELAYSPSVQVVDHPETAPDHAVLADYSPFTIAEFRDWLRQGGLYAPGQPFAGEAWEFSSRYAGDAGPGSDTNGDGHTLNGDFLTAFAAWDLKYFNWTLGPTPDTDTGAIPASVYKAEGWSQMPDGQALGFDAPRSAHRGEPWWELWALFRQRMVWRHNIDVARWMTTTPGLGGVTVPTSKWYSDQIPADYLFGFTPANPDFRLLASASPWWTADVRPYGGTGITSFNYQDPYGNYFRTLPGVFPEIAARHLRWGIFEWNPVVLADSDTTSSRADPAPYRVDTNLLVQHRPSVVSPFTWDNPDYPVRNTGFEIALKELAQALSQEPLTVSPSTLNIGMTANGAARTPPQNVTVSGAPGEHPPWSVLSASPFLTVVQQPDGRTLSVAVKGTLPAGITAGTIVVTSSDPTYTDTTLTVIVQVANTGTSTAPFGVFDTPTPNAVVSGEIGVTGWAVDDIGVAGVDIFRSPLAGESTQPNGLVFLGGATLVAGARSDVQAAYPTRPMSEKAGWGYMLLTNMLPGGGNGSFMLHAFARDVDGHSTLLGSRVITATNASAQLPFGTIDTPMQGETVSGTIVNFGWALTSLPNTIPVDGSTIGVYVDGIFLGHPVYNNSRSDIATLFPGYHNTDGAVGYFMLDTTLLTNGVHTIAWGVVDNAGNAQGIGSRYFTVSNP